MTSYVEVEDYPHVLLAWTFSRLGCLTLGRAQSSHWTGDTVRVFWRREYLLILLWIKPLFFRRPACGLVVCRLRGDVAPVQSGKKYEVKVSHFLLEVFIKCGQTTVPVVSHGCYFCWNFSGLFCSSFPLTYCSWLSFATLQWMRTKITHFPDISPVPAVAELNPGP